MQVLTDLYMQVHCASVSTCIQLSPSTSTHVSSITDIYSNASAGASANRSITKHVNTCIHECAIP